MNAYTYNIESLLGALPIYLSTINSIDAQSIIHQIYGHSKRRANVYNPSNYNSNNIDNNIKSNTNIPESSAVVLPNDSHDLDLPES